MLQCMLQPHKYYSAFIQSIYRELRSTTQPARRRAFKTKKFVMQHKNCDKHYYVEQALLYVFQAT
jgi:hypothetical protein